MRSFNQKISKVSDQCQVCGLVKNHCICDYDISIETNIEFWLLTHENELTRTNNTGRLIENAIPNTRVFKWTRTQPPKELIELIESNTYDIYLLFSNDRGEEVSEMTQGKKKAFIILDGTWKEARKILRKSAYLDNIKKISLNDVGKTAYDLRRNDDENHISTVEVAIEVLKRFDAVGSEALNNYFRYFMKQYHAGKFNHSEVQNDN